MDNQLDFYTNPQSRGRIVRWMLEEVGAKYKTHVMEYATSMKSPEYLAINPMGKVPAIRHNGAVVTECAAICAYLADAFPDSDLAPATDQRAAYYRWLFFAAGPLEAAVVNGSLKVEVADDQKAMVGYGSLGEALDAIEGALDENSHIAGAQFTAADVYMGSQITWGLQFGTIEKRDAFKRYSRQVTDRPAYAKANELDNALMGD